MNTGLTLAWSRTHILLNIYQSLLLSTDLLSIRRVFVVSIWMGSWSRCQRTTIHVSFSLLLSAHGKVLFDFLLICLYVLSLSLNSGRGHHNVSFLHSSRLLQSVREEHAQYFESSRWIYSRPSHWEDFRSFRTKVVWTSISRWMYISKMVASSEFPVNQALWRLLRH